MSESEKINICAIMHPKRGKEDALRKALLAIVEPTRSEEGAIAYDLHQEEGGAIFLYESWRSQGDLDEHFKKDYLKDLVRKLDDLIDGKNDAHFGKLAGENIDLFERLSNADDFNNSVQVCSIKKAKKGQGEQLKKSLLSLVSATKKEPGVIRYNVFEEKDGSLFLYEVWRSKKDLEDHFQKPYIKKFRKESSDLLEVNNIYIGKYISPPNLKAIKPKR